MKWSSSLNIITDISPARHLSPAYTCLYICYSSFRPPPLAVLRSPSVCSGRVVAKSDMTHIRWLEVPSGVCVCLRLMVKICFCSFLNSSGALNEDIVCNYTNTHTPHVCPSAFKTDVLVLQLLSLLNTTTLRLLWGEAHRWISSLAIRIRCRWRPNPAVDVMWSINRILKLLRWIIKMMIQLDVRLIQLSASLLLWVKLVPKQSVTSASLSPSLFKP